MSKWMAFLFAAGFGILTCTVYLTHGLFLPGISALAFAGLLILGTWRQWKWAPVTALFGAFGLIVTGLLIHLPSTRLISAGFCALAAWDLAELSFRLALASPEDPTARIQKNHLTYLILVLVPTGILSLAAGRLHFSIPFEWMAILILFSAWGIGQVMTRLLAR